MEFGLAVICSHTSENPPEKNFEKMLDQCRTARDSGFDFIWTGHHVILEENQRFQPVPSLARIAAESGDMRLGLNILMSFRHPIETAEQIATIDALSDGKAIFGPIVGYRPKEFEAYGVPRTQRGKRFREGVEIIKRLWTEDSVTYEGEIFSFEDVTITPKPVQDPRPPIWVGANSDKAVKRAAKIGDSWFVPPHDTPETIERQLGLVEEPTGSGYHGMQPAIAETFVAETDERAEEIFGPYIKEYYDWYRKAGQDEEMEVPEAMDLDSAGLGRFFIGSPETVAERIVELHELGVDALCLGMQKPGIPQDEMLTSIRLAGEEVFPLVEERI